MIKKIKNENYEKIDEIIIFLESEENTEILYVLQQFFEKMDTLQKCFQRKEYFLDEVIKSLQSFKSYLRKKNILAAKEWEMSIFNSTFSDFGNRFDSFDKYYFLDLLNHENFKSFKKEFPLAKYTDFLTKYDHRNEKIFDNTSFKNELVVLYQKPIFAGLTIKGILEIIDKIDASEEFEQIKLFISFINTIGVHTSTVERSFSCLKRVKSSSRSSMTDERLFSLVFISFEKKIVIEQEKTEDFKNYVSENFIK